MDHSFIGRAERLTSFNITTKDLQTLDYKYEVRHLFEKHFFSGVSITGVDTVDMESINHVVTKLKECDIDNFRHLHNYNLKGVGPGEMTLFCAIDSDVVAGGSSPGVDIITDCGEYEVKAAYISNDRIASNFKLGGTVSLGGLITDIDNLRQELKIPGTRTELSGSGIKAIKEAAPDEYKRIEDEFACIASDYFGGHKTIFVNHNYKTAKVGQVESIKIIEPGDVKIERVTSGVIKPAVRL